MEKIRKLAIHNIDDIRQSEYSNSILKLLSNDNSEVVSLYAIWNKLMNKDKAWYIDKIYQYLKNNYYNYKIAKDKIEFRIDVNTLLKYIENNKRLIYKGYRDINIPTLKIKRCLISLFDNSSKSYGNIAYSVEYDESCIANIVELRFDASDSKVIPMRLVVNSHRIGLSGYNSKHGRNIQNDIKLLAILLVMVNEYTNKIIESHITLPQNLHQVVIDDYLYNYINNANYISNTMNIIENTHYENRLDSKGHHNSPKTHIRRAHIRKYKNGKQVLIDTTVVNKDKNKAITYNIK